MEFVIASEKVQENEAQIYRSFWISYLDFCNCYMTHETTYLLTEDHKCFSLDGLLAVSFDHKTRCGCVCFANTITIFLLIVHILTVKEHYHSSVQIQLRLQS